MFSLKTIVFHFVSFRERKTSNLLPFEAVETFATECGVYDKSEVINMLNVFGNWLQSCM